MSSALEGIGHKRLQKAVRGLETAVARLRTNGCNDTSWIDVINAFSTVQSMMELDGVGSVIKSSNPDGAAMREVKTAAAEALRNLRAMARVAGISAAHLEEAANEFSIISSICENLASTQIFVSQDQSRGGRR